MFVAEAVYDFSAETMFKAGDYTQQEGIVEKQQSMSRLKQEQQTRKRIRSNEQQKQLVEQAEEDEKDQKQQEDDKEKEDHKQKEDDKQKEEDKRQDKQKQEGVVETQQATAEYLRFKVGEKILVKQAYENGWWYGNVIVRPGECGYFPSNYVKVGAKPPPPALDSSKEEEKPETIYDPKEGDWIAKELEELHKVEKGSQDSSYYHGISGYKYVKINEKNKNILNANYVKFDVATGLARVPIKDQAPAAKDVRQMGYYFDYHQWNEERNKNPNSMRGRPDPKRKKPKKLHLKMMD